MTARSVIFDTDRRVAAHRRRARDLRDLRRATLTLQVLHHEAIGSGLLMHARLVQAVAADVLVRAHVAACDYGRSVDVDVAEKTIGRLGLDGDHFVVRAFCDALLLHIAAGRAAT